MSLAGCGGGGGGAGPADVTASQPADTAEVTATASTPAALTALEQEEQAKLRLVPGTLPVSPPEWISGTAPTLADCEMFPATAIFNTRIDDTSRFPAHANSNSWVSLVGSSVPFTANWGETDNSWDVGYYGIPINIVDGTPATTDWPVLSYDFSTSGVNTWLGYSDKSDCAVPSGTGFDLQRNCSGVPPSQIRFPFPKTGKVLSEGGQCNDPNSCGDRHVLVVEKGACRLWESYFTYQLGNQWYSMATAAWDLKSLALRPNGWASSDAAGLPIAPLLARSSEAQTGEIRHALRVTFSDPALALAVEWPARYSAGGDTWGGIPFGALLRLKADFVIPSDWTPQARAVATAAKRYGLYVADNGPDFFVQGEPGNGWGSQTYSQLRAITMSNMEFVDLKAIKNDPRFSPDSMAARW